MPVFNVCFSFGTFEVFYTEVSDNQVKSQKRQFSILNISDSHMACASAVVQYSIISVIMLRVIMCEWLLTVSRVLAAGIPQFK